MANDWVPCVFDTTEDDPDLFSYINVRTGSLLTVDGGDDWTSLLEDLNEQAILEGKTLYFPKGTYDIESNLTISAAIAFAPGAKLKPADGVTIMIGGLLVTTEYQVFDLSSGGEVHFSNSLKIQKFSPEMFGALGDGISDDYIPWEGLKKAVNSAGAATVECRAAAHYRIDRYYDSVLFPDNTSTPWQSLSFFHFKGNGAKIDLKANFQRTAAITRMTLLPFSLRFSENIVIEDLELDGNVQDMTREPGLGEGSGNYGIELYDCNHVTFRNLWVHHFATDGILLGIENLCRNIRLEKVKCTNNARQGMSILAARQVYCVGCEFNDTGRDIGAYGAHSPGGGVDIEPDFIPEGGFCGDIVFEHCHFKNNIAQFYSSEPYNVERVTCRDCEFESLDGNPSLQVVAASKGVHFERCKFFLASGYILAGFAEPGDLHLQWVTFRDCEVHSTGEGMISDIDVLVELDNVKFFNTATAPSGLYSPYLNNPQLDARDCRVFRPKESYNGAGSYQTSAIWNVRISSGNRFVTDLDPAVAGAGAHFAVQYSNSTMVRGDYFFPTSNRAFRPGFSSDHPAGAPFYQEGPEVEAVGQPSISGTVHDLDVGTGKIVRALIGGATTITGFANGRKGRWFIFQNTDSVTHSVTLKHGNTGSVAGNRIITPSQTDFIIGPGEGVIIWYDHLSTGWRVAGWAP